MGMTMTQKILAAHAGLPSVEAGQLIEADLDLVLGNDVTTPVAIHEMEKFNKKEVFDKKKIALVMDHFTPNKDIKSAEHCKCVRQFSAANEIENYLTLEQWVSSMRSFRRKDLSLQERHVLVQTHIHVHTEHSVHSQQV